MEQACVIGVGGWIPPGGEDDQWRALIALDGVPVARVRLPNPGEAGEEFRRAAIDRHADGQRSYLELLERMERRLGVPRRAPKPLTKSVVVCTHRRPHMVAGLLEAIDRLDPAPHQLVVVDNDPGHQDVRALAEQAGAHYIREDVRGLDNARRAGLAAATGDVVAFTDDDCLPSPRWLRDLDELFDDPRVAAVTGPAFAHQLDAPAKRAFEESGGFGRGFHRRVHEWENLSPPGASRAGAGANMILRRAIAAQVGELFPPELDAGTPTQSGGDLYALYKLLAAGYRVVYDPGTYVLHRHRADFEAMHRTFRGYGTGLSAALTKLLLEERELTAPAAWRWLIEQWLDSLGGDALARRIGRDYLRGGLAGPTALRRAKRSSGQTRLSSIEHRASSIETRHLTLETSDDPLVSVVVTTCNRPDALRRCVAALSRQEPGTPPFEVIVVNDAHMPTQPIFGTRTIHTRGAGTGGARNTGAAAARGELLIFLDDDVVPEPDLVSRHLQAHSGDGNRVVIGYCEPRPRSRNLASLGATAWWEDHYRALRDAAALTFMDMLSGNMSVRRETFDRVGGFDPALPRREDWEWGIRVLECGVSAVYEPRARAAHEFTFSARKALAAGFLHGVSDAALIRRRPAAVAALPTRWSYRNMLRRPLKAALFLALQTPPGRSCGMLALKMLEWAKARPTWSRVFGLFLGAQYERGRREAGDPRRPAVVPPVVEIELDSDEPVPRPRMMAPRVRLLVRGETVSEFSAYGGHWGRTLAEQVARSGHWHWWRAVEDDTPPAHAPGVEVVNASTWRERDRIIRASFAQTLVIPLRETAPQPRWLDQAAEATRAERVALATGSGVGAGEPAQPVLLQPPESDAYQAIGKPPAYLALDRDAYELLGGVDLTLAPYGDHAVLLDLVQRALHSGWLVARRDVPGLPAPTRAESLSLTRARAFLQVGSASLRPALARLAAGLIPGGPTFAGGIAHAGAWLAGVAAARRYRSAVPPPAPASLADVSSGAASQWCSGRRRPSPAERPVMRRG